jgi:hypothetical protein
MLKTKRKMKSDMTQPMKAGCPKKPAAVEGGRMPNCSEDEDYFIAEACTNVTVDPIRGVGPKGENVWMRVHNKKTWLNLANMPHSDANKGFNSFDSLLMTKLMSFVFEKAKMLETRNIVVDY